MDNKQESDDKLKIWRIEALFLRRKSVRAKSGQVGIALTTAPPYSFFDSRWNLCRKRWNIGAINSPKATRKITPEKIA